MIANGERLRDVYSRESVFSRVKIGDNVFVGVGSVLLPGTSIRSNSIVGAGSVVKGTFPENSVICGVPARVVSSVDAVYEKHRDEILILGRRGTARRNDIVQHVDRRG